MNQVSSSPYGFKCHPIRSFSPIFPLIGVFAFIIFLFRNTIFPTVADNFSAELAYASFTATPSSLSISPLFISIFHIVITIVLKLQRLIFTITSHVIPTHILHSIQSAPKPLLGKMILSNLFFPSLSTTPTLIVLLHSILPSYLFETCIQSGLLFPIASFLPIDTCCSFIAKIIYSQRFLNHWNDIIYHIMLFIYHPIDPGYILNLINVILCGIIACFIHLIAVRLSPHRSQFIGILAATLFVTSSTISKNILTDITFAIPQLIYIIIVFLVLYMLTTIDLEFILGQWSSLCALQHSSPSQAALTASSSNAPLTYKCYPIPLNDEAAFTILKQSAYAITALMSFLLLLTPHLFVFSIIPVITTIGVCLYALRSYISLYSLPLPNNAHHFLWVWKIRHRLRGQIKATCFRIACYTCIISICIIIAIHRRFFDLSALWFMTRQLATLSFLRPNLSPSSIYHRISQCIAFFGIDYIWIIIPMVIFTCVYTCIYRKSHHSLFLFIIILCLTIMIQFVLFILFPSPHHTWDTIYHHYEHQLSFITISMIILAAIGVEYGIMILTFLYEIIQLILIHQSPPVFDNIEFSSLFSFLSHDRGHFYCWNNSTQPFILPPSFSPQSGRYKLINDPSTLIEATLPAPPPLQFMALSTIPAIISQLSYIIPIKHLQAIPGLGCYNFSGSTNQHKNNNVLTPTSTSTASSTPLPSQASFFSPNIPATHFSALHHFFPMTLSFRFIITFHSIIFLLCYVIINVQLLPWEMLFLSGVNNWGIFQAEKNLLALPPDAIIMTTPDINNIVAQYTHHSTTQRHHDEILQPVNSFWQIAKTIQEPTYQQQIAAYAATMASSASLASSTPTQQQQEHQYRQQQRFFQSLHSRIDSSSVHFTNVFEPISQHPQTTMNNLFGSIFTPHDDSYVALRYLQQCAGRRQDVIVLQMHTHLTPYGLAHLDHLPHSIRQQVISKVDTTRSCATAECTSHSFESIHHHNTKSSASSSPAGTSSAGSQFPAFFWNDENTWNHIHSSSQLATQWSLHNQQQAREYQDWYNAHSTTQPGSTSTAPSAHDLLSLSDESSPFPQYVHFPTAMYRTPSPWHTPRLVLPTLSDTSSFDPTLDLSLALFHQFIQLNQPHHAIFILPASNVTFFPYRALFAHSSSLTLSSPAMKSSILRAAAGSMSEREDFVDNDASPWQFASSIPLSLFAPSKSSSYDHSSSISSSSTLFYSTLVSSEAPNNSNNPFSNMFSALLTAWLAHLPLYKHLLQSSSWSTSYQHTASSTTTAAPHPALAQSTSQSTPSSSFVNAPYYQLMPYGSMLYIDQIAPTHPQLYRCLNTFWQKAATSHQPHIIEQSTSSLDSIVRGIVQRYRSINSNPFYMSLPPFSTATNHDIVFLPPNHHHDGTSRLNTTTIPDQYRLFNPMTQLTPISTFSDLQSFHRWFAPRMWSDALRSISITGTPFRSIQEICMEFPSCPDHLIISDVISNQYHSRLSIRESQQVIELLNDIPKTSSYNINDNIDRVEFIDIDNEQNTIIRDSQLIENYPGMHPSLGESSIAPVTASSSSSQNSQHADQQITSSSSTPSTSSSSSSQCPPLLFTSQDDVELAQRTIQKSFNALSAFPHLNYDISYLLSFIDSALLSFLHIPYNSLFPIIQQGSYLPTQSVTLPPSFSALLPSHFLHQPLTAMLHHASFLSALFPPIFWEHLFISSLPIMPPAIHVDCYDSYLYSTLSKSDKKRYKKLYKKRPSRPIHCSSGTTPFATTASQFIDPATPLGASSMLLLLQQTVDIWDDILHDMTLFEAYTPLTPTHWRQCGEMYGLYAKYLDIQRLDLSLRAAYYKEQQQQQQQQQHMASTSTTCSKLAQRNMPYESIPRQYHLMRLEQLTQALHIAEHKMTVCWSHIPHSIQRLKTDVSSTSLLFDQIDRFPNKGIFVKQLRDYYAHFQEQSHDMTYIISQDMNPFRNAPIEVPYDAKIHPNPWFHRDSD